MPAFVETAGRSWRDTALTCALFSLGDAGRRNDGSRDDGSNGRMRLLLFSAIRCAGYSGRGADNVLLNRKRLK